MELLETLPSAPKAMPWLGHGPALLRDPLGFLSALPDHGDLVKLRLGRQDVIVVCTPDLHREVLLDDCTYDKGGPVIERARELVGDGAATCPHGSHRRLSRLAQPSFRIERIPGYAQEFIAAANETADSWRDGQVIDATEEMTRLTLQAVVRTMFADALAPQSEQAVVEDINVILSGFIRQMATPSVVTRFPILGSRAYQQAHARLRHIVEEVIASRRRDSSDHGDFLSSLMAARDADSPDERGRLTESELFDQVMTVFLAGVESTANTLSWSLHFVTANPDVDRQLRAETTRVLAGASPTFARVEQLTMADRVLTETLRLYPAPLLTTRTVTSETELGGVVLPVGTMLALSAYLIHRREDLYAEPRRFNPDRWLHALPDRRTYFPFGAGARQCIGKQFAQVGVKLALTVLLDRWRLEPLTGTHPQVSSLTLTPKNLHLRVSA
jgi:cytochrome P450